MAAMQKGSEFTRDQLYDALYGARNLQGKLVQMAYTNLDLQLDYLIDKGHVLLSEGGKFTALGSTKL